MKAFRPSRWLRLDTLDLEYPKDFPDSSSSLVVNVKMAMRFDAAVAATMMELQQRACGCVCLLLNSVMERTTV